MSFAKWGAKNMHPLRSLLLVPLTALVLAAGSLPVSSAVISTVSFNGGFSDGGRGSFNASGNFKPGTSPLITFTNALTGAKRIVGFDFTFDGTTDEGNGIFSDLVTIRYGTLFGSGFLANPADFAFDGADRNGRSLPIDRVVDFTEAGLLSSGYVLNTRAFPAFVVGFRTQQAGLPGTNGAPNSAFFTLNYSYKIPEPASLALVAVGIVGLAGALRRRARL
jgi:hypothetical protein